MKLAALMVLAILFAGVALAQQIPPAGEPSHTPMPPWQSPVPSPPPPQPTAQFTTVPMSKR